MLLADVGYAGFEAAFTLVHRAERLRLGADPQHGRADLDVRVGKIDETKLWRADCLVRLVEIGEGSTDVDSEVFVVQVAYAVALAPGVDLGHEQDILVALWPHMRSQLLALAPTVSDQGLRLPFHLELEQRGPSGASV